MAEEDEEEEEEEEKKKEKEKKREEEEEKKKKKKKKKRGREKYTMEAASDVPPIAPGKKVKIEMYNNGYDLITTVTYPEKEYSLCTCSFYLLCAVIILWVLCQIIKWYFWPKSKKEKRKKSRSKNKLKEEKEQTGGKSSDDVKDGSKNGIKNGSVDKALPKSGTDVADKEDNVKSKPDIVDEENKDPAGLEETEGGGKPGDENEATENPEKEKMD
ncbi:hypothetical protein WDU94_008013 [Cyamophila willieti]